MKKREYKDLNELLENNFNNSETDEATRLIAELNDVKRKKFFTKKQFYDVAMWKTPRPKKYYLSNPEKIIRKISREAIDAKSEEDKMLRLTSLKGVSIAVASSLLTIMNPKDYGIIDIRVWQLLYKYDEVKTKPHGQGFNLKDWLNYLSILRKYAVKFDTSVRNVERTLFFYHKKVQIGKLYDVKKIS